MTSTCAGCGEEHDGLTRYFNWRRPEIDLFSRFRLTYDNDFVCRVGNSRHFISCELEVAFRDGIEGPLGFIGWIEVARSDYSLYLAYRQKEDSQTAAPIVIEGTLANPVPGVDDSQGTRVRFEVIQGDPTPYIKWVEPGTAVYARLEEGATSEFWHRAAGWL